MKLATYKDGSRDGQLVVVSRDLSQAHYATGIATRLQQALAAIPAFERAIAAQENLISIRPKEAGDRRLTMTAEQGRRVWGLSLLIIPGAILAMGVHTWWRRR